MRRRDEDFIPRSSRSAEEVDNDLSYWADVAEGGRFYADTRALRDSFRETVKSYGGLADCIFSKEEYPREVGNALKWLEFALRDIKNGNADEAASAAFRAGMSVQASSLYVHHEKDAWLGRHQHKNLDELRQNAIDNAQNRADERRRLIAQMVHDTKLTGGALEKYLHERLKNEHGLKVSYRTIRRDLKTIHR